MQRAIPWLLLAGCPSGTLTVPGTKTSTGSTTSDPETPPDTETTPGTTATGATGSTGDTGGEEVDPPDLLVDCNGAGDFVTIQAAIDASASGDRIGVAPCVYHERIDLRGKAVDLYGIDGSAATTIDGDGEGTVVNVESGEADGIRIAGFTVTGGDDDNDGAAFEISYATLDAEDLVLTGNTGLAVLWSDASMVDLDNVVITGNTLDPEGQAIFSDGGGLTARALTVDCDAGREAIYHHNVLLLSDSTIRCPSGLYGIHDYHGEDRILRSVVIGGEIGIYAYDVESTDDLPDNPNERFEIANVAVSGGISGVDVRYMDVGIGNSVLTGGTSALSVTALMEGSRASGCAFVGADCGISADAPFGATYSAFWDNAANGCGLNVSPTVTADPMFVSFPTDLHLSQGSPLVDAGPPGSAFSDADGTRNDIGAYGGPLPLP